MTTINGLLNQIADDEIVLPAIQRDFVWSEDQIERLLDSVMRGYPIGIVLLWETYNNIQYRRFAREYRSGTLHTYSDNSGQRRLKVVLDGQQRLQTLYVALRGQRNGKALYLDVLSGEDSDDVADDRYLFYFLSSEEAASRNEAAREQAAARDDLDKDHYDYLDYLVPVSRLFRMSTREQKQLSQELAPALRLTDEETLLLETTMGTFDDMLTKDPNILKLSTIDEDLAADSPDRKSEADVLEIFVRINREGTALSRSDLIFSMLKLNWKESAEGLPEFVESVNEGNSFGLDTDFVVRCLFAVSNLGSRLDLDLLRNRRNVNALRDNFEQTCNAIRATVDFVATECRCQSSTLLGSSHTLVPIVYYLFHLPRHDVPNEQVENLRTAVYLLGLARPFSRYADSRVGAYIRQELQPALEDGSTTFPLQETVGWVKYWEPVSSLEDLSQRNSRLLLHLVQGLAGQKMQYSRNAPEIDHIFPRAELRKKDYDEDEINDFANFWVLAQGKNRNKSNRPPKDYFADVSDRQLTEALIERRYLDYRRYKAFLRTRGEALISRLEGILGLSDDDL